MTMDPLLASQSFSCPLSETFCSPGCPAASLRHFRGWGIGPGECLRPKVGPILGRIGKGWDFKWDEGISPAKLEESQGQGWSVSQGEEISSPLARSHWSEGWNISTLSEVSRFCVQPSTFPWTIGEERILQFIFQATLWRESPYNNPVTILKQQPVPPDS